jgi:cytoskeletal protein CcmA (bactofilin family)
MKFNSGKEVTRQTFQDTIANRISKGAVIEGEIKSETDIRIDGKIKGILHCTAKVVIGQTGIFEGDMQCKEASIEGHITGKVQINGLLYIKKTARLEGEIFYKRLIVEEGANISGTLTMSGGTTKKMLKDNLEEVKSGVLESSPIGEAQQHQSA